MPSEEFFLVWFGGASDHGVQGFPTELEAYGALPEGRPPILKFVIGKEYNLKGKVYCVFQDRAMADEWRTEKQFAPTSKR